MEAEQIVALSSLLTLGRGAAALLLLWGLLRVLDHLADIRFKEWKNAATSHDLALYFGLRFLGSAILLGLVFS